jgi:hypothetical protein
MTRLLIIGPPGSGKGTQAVHIARHFKVPAVSTGEIFRTNVSAETPLGQEAAQYLDDGAFVPDHLTNALVRERLRDSDVRPGFLSPVRSRLRTWCPSSLSLRTTCRPSFPLPPVTAILMVLLLLQGTFRRRQLPVL